MAELDVVPVSAESEPEGDLQGPEPELSELPEPPEPPESPPPEAHAADEASTAPRAPEPKAKAKSKAKAKATPKTRAKPKAAPVSAPAAPTELAEEPRIPSHIDLLPTIDTHLRAWLNTQRDLDQQRLNERYASWRLM